MRKKLSLILTLILLVMLLTGCGSKKPDGMYLGYDDYGSQMALLFDGDSLTISNATYGLKTVGTYSISGKTLTYTTTVFGVTSTEQMSYQKKGDTITLNGTKYTSVLEDSGPSLGFWIVILVLAIGVYAFLKLDPKVARAFLGKLKAKTAGIGADKVTNTAKKFTDSAADVGRRVAKTTKDLGSTVSASVVSGIEATKNAARERNEARQNRLSDEDWELDDGSGASQYSSKPVRPVIRPDRCCICGASLSEGKTRLFTTPDGTEAYIDPGCHNALYILNKSDDKDDVGIALRYAKSRLDEVDPNVATVIQKFISKAESRI